MDFRVDFMTLVNRALANTRRQTVKLGKLQEQAATGKRLHVPSDDPGKTLAALAGKARDTRFETYTNNVREARTTLDVGVSALREAGNILSKARELAIEGAHSANDKAAFDSLAQQVDHLIDRLIEVSNTRHKDRYLFSGTDVNAPTFSVTGTGLTGQIQSVAYQGSAERTRVPISDTQTVATRYIGSEIFQSRERGPTVYSGTTGATAGTGTDSATGQGTLIVRHDTTTYAPGSGILGGASSATSDTVIGPAGVHQLTINDTSGTGASGTISLNGGPPVAFTNADTDLKITGPNKEVVYVNTTAITPGFNGTVAITANGSLSTDGGASFTAINFSANQVVTNSATGQVTNVNSTNIRQAGTNDLNYTGTFDTFQALIALRDDLRNTRGLDAVRQIESISQRMEEFERLHTSVLGVVGEQSASLQQLDALESYFQDVQLTTRKWVSELEDADLSEVLLNLQAQENLLRLTLATTARVMDQSLLDFIS